MKLWTKNPRTILFRIILLLTLLVIIYLWPDTNNLSSQSTNTTKEIKCTRTERYKNPPEFDRALSLINQRALEYSSKNNMSHSIITPCIIVKYTNMSTSDTDAEGYFIFGDKDMNQNYLPIYVDKKYQSTDDLITALLLVHEITHAGQYMDSLNGKNKLSCLDKEVQAFLHQANFIAQLNDEERNSIWYRILHGSDSNLNPQLYLVKQFSFIETDARKVCKNDSKCFSDQYTEGIKEMVYANQTYQEQCKR